MPKPPARRNDAVDAMQPWTIRAFPTALKAALIDASIDERVTVGALLERIIRAWMDDGKPRPIAPDAPPQAAENMVANYVSAPVVSLLEAVQAAVVLAHLPTTDPLVRAARSSVRAALNVSRQASLSVGKSPSATPSATVSTTPITGPDAVPVIEG